MLLDFHPDAYAELEAAVRWLEGEREGRGRRFYESVQRRVAQASRLPKSGAPITGLGTEYDVRCYTIREFQYRVVTARIENNLVVVAIAHTKRRPNYWRSRV